MKYDLFVSYSHRDQDAVRTVVRFLEMIGVRVWFDMHRGPFEGKLPPKLATAIENSQFFAFVESENTDSCSAYLELEAQHFRDARKEKSPLPFLLLRLSVGNLPPAVADLATPITDWFELGSGFLDGLAKLAKFFRPSDTGILKYFPMDKVVPPEFLDMLIDRGQREICLVGHSMAGVFGSGRAVNLVGPALDASTGSLKVLLLTPNLPRLQQLREAQMGLRRGTLLHEKILETLGAIKYLKAERDDVGVGARIQVRVTDRIMYSKLYFSDNLGIVTNYSSVGESGDNSPAFLVHETGEPGNLYSFGRSEFQRHWDASMHPEEAKRRLELNDATRILGHRDEVAAIQAWLAGKNASLPPPAMLIVYPTYHCSARHADAVEGPVCVDCIYGEKRSNQHMPVPVLEKIVQSAKDHGIVKVEFSGGGEPLQYDQLPRLIELVANAKNDADVAFGLLTNGLHLDTLVRSEAASAFEYVRVNYADGVLSDTVMHRAFLDGLRALLESVKDSPTPRIGLKFLVSRANATELVSRILKLRDTLGQHLFRRVDHIRVKALRSTRRRIEPRIEDCTAFKGLFYDHLFTFPEEWPEDVQIDLDIDDVPDDFRCQVNPLIAVVAPDGVVWPCCNYLNMHQEQQIGDLEHEGLMDFWGSERHRQIVLGIRPRRVCNARNGAACRFARYQEVLERSLPGDRPSIPWTSINYL